MRNALLVLIAFLGLSALVSSAHRHTDAWAPPPAATDEIRYLPSGDSLKLAALGFEPMLADLLWVRAVLLFGEHYGKQDDSWYPWMFHMTDLATELDPQFRAAYKMGGTMLRTGGVFVDQSSIIFQKGMRAMPQEWYFPFSIGMNYYMYKDDSKIAARFMRIAAETGGGPVYVRNLAASMLSNTNQVEVARAFLAEELKTLPPGTARDVTLVKLYEIDYERAQSIADAAIAKYRTEMGHMPESPRAIAAEGYALPPDPLADVSFVASLDIRPPSVSGWIWDPDPEAPPGTVVSAGFEEVFRQIAKATGYGGLGIDRSKADAVH